MMNALIAHKYDDQTEVANEQTYDPLGFLTNESWTKILAVIQKVQRTFRKWQECKNEADPGQEDFKNMLRGIYHRMDTGSKWNQIPAKFGDYKTIYAYFRRWIEIGIWRKVDRVVRKEEEKIINQRIKEAVEKTFASKRPEPSDFQKATEAVNGLGYWLKKYINKLPFIFDFLTDDEQSSLSASLESDLENFSKLLRRLGNNEGSAELAALIKEKLENWQHIWSAGAKNHSDFKEAQHIVNSINFHLNLYLEKIVAIFDNLTDNEKSKINAALVVKWECLQTLLNEIKEVEQLNRYCQIL